jgi:hypothetical protein
MGMGMGIGTRRKGRDARLLIVLVVEQTVTGDCKWSCACMVQSMSK